MIDENNFKQVLFEYTMEKYENKLDEFYDKFFDEFPYDYKGISDELHFKNFIDWLMIEKKLPETGKTIVEEFVCQHPELNEEMKQKLLNMKNVISSEFVVLSKNKLELTLKDRKTGNLYPARLYSNVSGIGRNTLIIGRIHPFGTFYRFAGAFISHNSPMILDTDVLMNAFEDRSIEQAESIVLAPYAKLTAILNKYPFQWVDGICDELGIDVKEKKDVKVKLIANMLQSNIKEIIAAIPQKSKEALNLILNNGGFLQYGKLKAYDDEISFWWNENPPKSTIGILRLKGILAVGKMPIAGRMYKVAVIPKDIIGPLQKVNDM